MRRMMIAAACVVALAGLVAAAYVAGHRSAVNDLEGTAREASRRLKDDPAAGAILGAAMSQAKTQSTQLESVVNLKKIGLSLTMYANSHPGQGGPANLAELVKAADLDPAALRCPLPGVSYVYRGCPANPADNALIALESKATDGLVNVLSGEGSVRPLTAEKARKATETGVIDKADLR